MELKNYLSEDRGRQAVLCKAIGAHAPDVSRWASGERPVPVHRCRQIERATGLKVRCWDLRPHDWHRIWPELIGAEGAPEVSPSEAKAA